MLVPYASTTNFDIVYDSALTDQGIDGATLCQAILDHCEFDKLRLQVLFGDIPITPPGKILVELVPGSGGASEQGESITLQCEATADASILPALMVAEEAEIFMQYQQKGWIYNWSTGEALSRVCAQILYPASTGFESSSSWLNSSSLGYTASDCAPCPPPQLPPDWIDYVCQTDTDEVSVGCGTLFLNYLAYQLNLSWPDIIAAGTGPSQTLANTAQLLGVTDVWNNFLNLINANILAPDIPPATSPIFRSPFTGEPVSETDNPYPLGGVSVSGPLLYLRHNLADDGTSHEGSLSDSPDIIVTSTQATDPQSLYSTAESIASDMESDPAIAVGQTYYIYTRVWNRGSNAINVFSHVFWAQPSTLVTPENWNYIGSAYYPGVPPNQAVTVSNPGILWPADQLPGAGHYCFIAVVGNSWDPPPTATDFATFDGFVNYIYANNDITWRNFNVVEASQQSADTPGQLLPLPFRITAAWDEAHLFSFETHVQFPVGSQVSLEVPHLLGEALMPDLPRMQQLLHPDPPNEIAEPRRTRFSLNPFGIHTLPAVELPAGSSAASTLYVSIPREVHLEPYTVYIRQLYKGREVGRITWILMPPRLTVARDGG